MKKLILIYALLAFLIIAGNYISYKIGRTAGAQDKYLDFRSMVDECAQNGAFMVLEPKPNDPHHVIGSCIKPVGKFQIQFGQPGLKDLPVNGAI